MKWPMRRGGRPLCPSPSPLPHRRGTDDAARLGDGRGQKRPRSRATPSTACRPCRKSPLAAEDDAQHSLEDLVGTVSETREEHLKRHSGGRRTCPRCRFYLHGARWRAAYGTSVVRVGGQRPVWLTERPPRWGGAWSLGCTFCSDLLARTQLDGVAVAGCQTRRLGSRWARYEVRDKVIQAEHVKQHAHCEHHKLAERAFARPDAPVDLRGQVTVEDERLLSGAVPQPEDWLRTWRAAKSGSSWAAAAVQQSTENFLHQLRTRAPERRALQQMGDVLREVIREGKRDWVRQASSIALSFDDRKGYKLLLFRCDAPAASQDEGHTSQETLAAPQGPLQCPWRSGIVGCCDCLRHTTLEDLAEDYAVRTAKDIVDLIRRFCADDALSQRFLRITHIIVADGALQKVAQSLKHTDMPNLRLITRDPAHMVRIACKEPLLRTGRFEAQHRRLFEDRHALLKDVQFSDLWQARLADSQAKVCRADGAQGGGVQRIMRHFGYAPQRFESWADPRRKYVCCLNAIAIMLADLAGDERQTLQVRERAQRALDAMTAKDIFEAGISADFGEVCMRFLREWDASNHDPAGAAASLRRFGEDLKVLFVDGYIMCDSRPALAATQGEWSRFGTAKTIVEIAYEQFHDKVELRYGRRTKMLWSSTSKDERAAVLAEIASVVNDALTRLAADFHEQDLYMTLEAFHLDTWEGVLEETDRPRRRERRAALLGKAGRCCAALDVPFRPGAFVAAARAAVALRKTQPPGVDGRHVWASIARREHAWLSSVVAFYVAHPDGTGDVERGLGLHARLRQAHLGAIGDVAAAEMCLEVSVEGPREESDLFIRSHDGHLLLTPFSRRLAHIWLERHGRRFTCQKRRSDVGKARPVERLRGTMKAVSLGQKLATAALLRMARDDAANPGAPSRTSIIGTSRAKLVALAAAAPAPKLTKRLQDFRETTARRLQQKAASSCWPGFGPEPPKLRRRPGAVNGSRLGEPKSLSAEARAAPPRPAAEARAAPPRQQEDQGPPLHLCAPVVGEGPVQYRRLPALTLQAAPFVSVHSLQDLATASLSDCLLLAWLDIIARGKTVRACMGDRRPEHFSAARLSAKAVFHCTERFRRKHRRLAEALESSCRAFKSKWAMGDGPGALAIDSMADMRDRLLSLRRMPLVAGVDRSRLK